MQWSFGVFIDVCRAVVNDVTARRSRSSGVPVPVPDGGRRGARH